MPTPSKSDSYRTIAAVTKELKTSVKTINKLIKDKKLPAPEIIPNGNAPFRHYNDNFMLAAKEYFRKRAEDAQRKTVGE